MKVDLCDLKNIIGDHQDGLEAENLPGGPVIKTLLLVGELRSHMPCSQKSQNLKKRNTTTNSIKTIKNKKIKRKEKISQRQLYHAEFLRPGSLQNSLLYTSIVSCLCVHLCNSLMRYILVLFE